MMKWAGYHQYRLRGGKVREKNREAGRAGPRVFIGRGAGYSVEARDLKPQVNDNYPRTAPPEDDGSVVRTTPSIPIHITRAKFPVVGLSLAVLLILGVSYSVATYFTGSVVKERVALHALDDVTVWVSGCHVRFDESDSGRSYVDIYGWGNKMRDMTETFDSHEQAVLEEEWNEANQHGGIHAKESSLFTWIKALFGSVESSSHDLANQAPLKDFNATIRRNADLANDRYETWRRVDTNHLFIGAELKTKTISTSELCSIHFHLAPDYQFNSLDIIASESEDYVHIKSHIVLKAVSLIKITALHADIELTNSIEAKKMQFKLRDGYLFLSLDGDTSTYDFETDNALQIDSRTAPIYIKGSIPMDITLTEQQATRLYVRAYDIDESRFSSSDGTLHRHDPGSMDFTGSDKSLKLTCRTKNHSLSPSVFHNSGASFSITLPYKSQSPLYIELRDIDPESKEPIVRSLDKGWAGVEHIDQPHLLSFSASLVQDLKSWLKRDISAPWIMNINPISPWLDMESYWRFVSSDAYASGTVSWFTVLSAGLLKPRYRTTQLHILGTHCRGSEHKLSLESLNAFRTSYSIYTDLDVADDDLYLIASRYQKKWPSIYPGEAVGIIPPGEHCQNEAIDQTYVVLWKALSQMASPGTLVLWIQDNFQPLKFKLTADVVMRSLVTLSDTWLFNVAASVNVVVSFVCAAYLVSKYLPTMIRSARQYHDSKTIENAASHRLINVISEFKDDNTDDKDGSWTINVTEITHPGHGFAIKWNEACTNGTARLAVHIFQSDSQGAVKPPLLISPEDREALLIPPKKAEDEGNLIVLYFTMDAVIDTVVFGMKQFELLIPVKNPKGDFHPGCDQAYELAYKTKYKIRIMSLNVDARVINASKWSDDVALNIHPTFYLLPRHCLTSSKSTTDSLDIFVSRHLVRRQAFKKLIRFSRFSFAIDDTRGGPNGKPIAPVSFRLVIFAGDYKEMDRRSWQRLNWKLGVYAELDITGSPEYVNGAYVFQCNQEVNLAVEFVQTEQISFMAFDKASNHLLARGRINDGEWLKAAIDQYDNDEWGANWNPRVQIRMLQGKDSARSWGQLEFNMHHITSRLFTNHVFAYSKMQANEDLICFIDDFPGTGYAEGYEIVLRWKWSSRAGERPSQIDIGVYDNLTGERLLVISNIANTGSLCWGLKIPIIDTSRQIFFKIERFGVLSNTFVVVKVFSLTEFEFAYAAFCRTYNYEMIHISPDILRHLFKLEISSVPLKVCANLRKPLPFEHIMGQYFHCPGQFVISINSIVCKDHLYKSVTQHIDWIQNFYLNPDKSLWSATLDIVLNQHSVLPSRIYASTFRFMEHLASDRQGSGPLPHALAKGPLLSENQIQQIVVHWIPGVLDVAFKMALVLYYLAFTLLTISLYISYNLASFDLHVHYLPTVRYVYDVFFSPMPWPLFLLHIPFPGSLLVVVNLLWCGTVILNAFLEPSAASRRLAKYLKISSYLFQWTQFFTILFFIISFVLWFAVGALINSSQFLPYAVFLGSTLFVTYTLWCNYRQAADLVIHYIDENQQTLLSICFDRWFESEGLDSEIILQQQDDEEAAELSRLRRLFQSQIRQWKHRKLRQITDVIIRSNPASQNLSIEGDELGSSRSRLISSSGSENESWNMVDDQGCLQTLLAARLKKEVCWWDLVRLVADVSSGDSFYLDHDGKVHGVDKMNLPKHSQIASIKDLSHNGILQELLMGFDAALLQDGIIYGPRLNFRIERQVTPGQRYAVCIMKIPVWAEPEVLEPFMKVCLIMAYFDDANQGFWTSAGVEAWIFHCGGDSSYREVYAECANQVKDYFRPDDLEKFYTHYPERLDVDYLVLYGQGGIKTAGQAPSAGPSSVHLNSVISTDEKPQAEAMDVLDIYDFEDDEADKDLEDDQTLTSGATSVNLNALRLKYIYRNMTEKNRGSYIKSLMCSVPFIAQNIVDLQFAILYPIFGRDFLLPPSASNLKTASSGRFLLMMKNLHCDLLREIEDRADAHHAKLFERNHVQKLIGKFYDKDMVENIQLKAARLTDTRIDLNAQDLAPENRWILAHNTVTAKQAIRNYTVYRSRNILTLRDKLQLINVMNRLDLKVSLIVEVLVNCGILRQSEIVVKTSEDGEYTIYDPLSNECSKFIENIVNGIIGDVTVNHLTEILEKLCNEYLWLSEFRALLSLCGVKFRDSLLPGRVFDDDTSYSNDLESMKAVISDVLAITQVGNENVLIQESVKDQSSFKNRNLIEIKNICLMKRIFDKFSNFSNFLPIDLADEAILLITDNKLPTSAILPCLHKLEIGDLSYMQTSNLVNEIEANRGSQSHHSETLIIEDWVADNDGRMKLVGDLKNMLDNSYETLLLPVDLDWSRFGITDSWPKMLRECYASLTTTSPGFIAKNQLAELVQKVQLFFTADVKLIGFQAFHTIMMELGYSVARKHSRLLWCLINLDLSCINRKPNSKLEDLKVTEVLPLIPAAHSLVRTLLQPCDKENQALSLQSILEARPNVKDAETPLDMIVEYGGYLTQSIFSKLIHAIGVDVSDRSIHNLWKDIMKDPMVIKHLFDIDAPESDDELSFGSTRHYHTLDDQNYHTNAVLPRYLKVNMDPAGLDPFVGFYSEVDRVRRVLPRFLCSGLWPAALDHLLRLNLNIIPSSSLPTSSLNKYGLVRPEYIPMAIESMNSQEGMSFQMLDMVIEGMDLDLPPRESTKKLFDSLDINRDGTLDMTELLNGFEILLSRLLPIKIFEGIGLTQRHFWLKILTVFLIMSVIFLFTGLAFASFVGAESGDDSGGSGGGNTTVQSILALLGAVGLQSGASQDSDKVVSEMKLKLENVLFPDSKKSTVHLEEQITKNARIQAAIFQKTKLKDLRKARNIKIKPVSLEYQIPSSHRPNVLVPRPAVTIIIGELMKIEPVLTLASGVLVTVGTMTDDSQDVDNLIINGLTRISSKDASIIWSVTPPFPRASGLVFDVKTGTIRTDWKHCGKLVAMQRQCFSITARNHAGLARTRISLQTINRA